MVLAAYRSNLSRCSIHLGKIRLIEMINKFCLIFGSLWGKDGIDVVGELVFDLNC
jgi:hypothetical protein